MSFILAVALAKSTEKSFLFAVKMIAVLCFAIFCEVIRLLQMCFTELFWSYRSFTICTHRVLLTNPLFAKFYKLFSLQIH